MRDDRRRQVETTRQRHGKDHYKKIGKLGGKKRFEGLTPDEISKLSKEAINARYRQAKQKKVRPKDDRKRQVETTIQRHGKDFYRQLGKLGGPKSTRRFDTEGARKAANARWAKYREAKNKKEQNEHIQGVQPTDKQ